MQSRRNLIYIIVFLNLAFFLWTGLSKLPGPKEEILTQDVLADLKFENTIYTTSSWESWPEKLYQPQELVDATDPVTHDSVDYKKVQYATHRLNLQLIPGTTYGLSYYSSNYSMILFIDGVQIEKIGQPASTRTETEPLVKKMVTYFTPQNEVTEIVVQTANFVHGEGAQAPKLVFGKANDISQYERNENLKMGIVFGCLVTAGMYYLSIFIMNRRQVSSLVFAALNVLLAFASGDYLLRLFPSYSWQLSIRLEYIVFILAAAVLAILVNLLFPKALNKYIYRSYLFLCIADILFILLSDSVTFTSIRLIFQVISVAMIFYGNIRLFLTLKDKKLKNYLSFSGIFLLSFFIVVDILLRYNVGLVNYFAGKTFNAAGGMVLFIFCYVLVMSIEQAQINDSLKESRLALATAQKRYDELMQEKNSLSVRITDFGLTNRETDVILLLLDGKTRDEIADLLYISMGTVNSHCTNIYRKTECCSVADLIRKFHP